MNRCWVTIAIVVPLRRRLRLIMYDFEVWSSVMWLSIIRSVVWTGIMMAIVWLSMVLSIVVAIMRLLMILRLSYMMMTCCALWLLLSHRDMQLVYSPALS